MMLGIRLRRERTNTCRFGCCARTDAHRRRTTKTERARDKRAWKREVRRRAAGEHWWWEGEGGLRWC